MKRLRWWLARRLLGAPKGSWLAVSTSMSVASDLVAGNHLFPATVENPDYAAINITFDSSGQIHRPEASDRLVPAPLETGTDSVLLTDEDCIAAGCPLHTIEPEVE